MYTFLPNFKKNFVNKPIIIFLLFLFGSFSVNYAQGDLMITPRRVVFEGSRKSQELILANIGKDTARYFISVVQIRMKEDGNFETITEPDSGQYFADKYFRFFPRSVSLAPNEAQAVKVQLSKTDKMSPGEYRSHLYFRSEPNTKALGDDFKERDSSVLTIRLTPVFGITIPVIIRVGEVSAKAQLTELSFTNLADTLPRVTMKVLRTGNMSIYGDITVEYVPEKGASTKVGYVKGFAVYTPNKSRWFHVDLNKKKKVDYHSGKLVVSFSTESDSKNSPMAKEEILLK